MTDIRGKVKQREVQVLRQGYSRSVRRLEVASIVGYVILMLGLGVKLAPFLGERPWVLLAAALTGYLAADFVSGFVHWLGDTWGSPQTPLIGQALVRPFREHHVDQKGITRHDFIETNGNNCLISIPAGLIALAIPLDPGELFGLRLFLSASITSLILWVMATNQFHKWAHADERPAWVSFLQRIHLILPPEHHAIHHAAPFAKYYCITTGWLNWPLHKLRFFPLLERLMTATLGWLPREDDIGVVAAIEAAPVQVGAPELSEPALGKEL